MWRGSSFLVLAGALIACGGDGTSSGDAASGAGTATSGTGAMGGATTTSASSTGGGGPGGGGTGGGGTGGASFPTCAVLAPLDPATMPHPGSGSDAYTPATDAERAALVAALQAAPRDPATALAASEVAGYALCAGEGAEQGLLLFQPPPGKAWIVLRTSPQARPLQVQAPHAFFEGGTLEEAVVIFEQLSARAIIATGTHRCASSSASTCDGTTSVCGSPSAPYRTSDMAHVVDSTFHDAQLTLAAMHEQDVVVSLHGMQRDGVSLSNGTSATTAPTSLVAQLTDALALAFPNALVTTCNDYGAGNQDLHLCGSTNTQGRALNGASSPCTSPATMATGRFLHLEQHAAIRQEPATVAAALGTVIP